VSGGGAVGGTRQPLVFLGASTALREISPLVRAAGDGGGDGYEIVAVLDDDAALHGTTIGGVRVVGGLEQVERYPDAHFVLGIGSFRTRLKREEILERLGLPEERFPAFVHPRAIVYPGTRIAHGAIVHAGVVVGPEVTVGAFSIIAFNSLLGPYSRTGRCAMVASSVTVLSGATIGGSAFVGAASCIAEGVRIGPGAMVGMATVVHRSVGPGAFVLGNPARVLYSVRVPARLTEGWEPAAAGVEPS
jgi:sugar O-acyltransferase (sialic acid O-acetyltransferase NeuD family)